MRDRLKMSVYCVRMKDKNSGLVFGICAKFVNRADAYNYRDKVSWDGASVEYIIFVQIEDVATWSNDNVPA